MLNKLYGAALVGQSGGPTAAINSSLAGVIEGFFNSEYITKLYGMKNGIEGFLSESIVNLGDLFASDSGLIDNDKIMALKRTPSAALGSCRKKLPDPDEDEAFFENLLSLFKKYDIRYFFYIGGNDSMDTVAKLSKYLKKADYEMRTVGLPKTIDNDLSSTDHSPGFGSAAKYVATTVQEIVRDCAVYKTKAVTIVEIMGRDAGWLTASSALAAHAPDYIYLPETPFSDEKFLSDIEKAFLHHPNVVIAVSEGLRYENGRYVGEGAQSGKADIFGHKYLAGVGKALEALVRERIGCKVRSVELNLPQRCAAHLASLTDLSEAENSAKTGVSAAESGESGIMIAIKRNNTPEYSVSYTAMDVTKIANQIQSVPKDYIVPDGNYVNEKCIAYMRPLIMGEAPVMFENGVPVHFIIE